MECCGGLCAATWMERSTFLMTSNPPCLRQPTPPSLQVGHTARRQRREPSCPSSRSPHALQADLNVIQAQGHDRLGCTCLGACRERRSLTSDVGEADVLLPGIQDACRTASRTDVDSGGRLYSPLRITNSIGAG